MMKIKSLINDYFIVVEPGKEGWSKGRCAFGPEVFHPDGTLDREKLGKIVFNDPSKRHLLNAITHPEIYKGIMWEVLAYLINGKFVGNLKPVIKVFSSFAVLTVNE